MVAINNRRQTDQVLWFGRELLAGPVVRICNRADELVESRVGRTREAARPS